MPPAATKMEYQQVPGSLGQLLNTCFTTPFRSGYLVANDVIVPEYFQQFGEAIQNLTVHDSDVWVCSFPKTGTTWTQEMVWCIANDMDMEGAKQILDVRFPFLEHSPLFDYTDLLKQNPDMKFPEYATDSVGFVNRTISPRFIKTHLPWDLLPAEIRSGVKKPKVIYVTRNPKDTCVSYFHHCRLMEGYNGTFEDFVTLFTGNRVCFAPFWEHVFGFWNRRDVDNVLFIRYEDMKKDLRPVIRQVEKFLGKHMSDTQVDALVQHLSFESMKTNKAVNYEHAVEINKKYNLTDTNGGSFMRSGQVGGYKAEMTPEMITKLDTWTAQHLNGTDLII